LLNTRVDIFSSRLLHILGGSLLVGTSAVSLLYRSAELLYPKFFIFASVVVLMSGMYNVHALQIGAKLGDAAGVYRMVAYGGKIVLLMLLSPLLDKVLPTFINVHWARFLITVLTVALGTWLRYYREKNTKDVSRAGK